MRAVSLTRQTGFCAEKKVLVRRCNLQAWSFKETDPAATTAGERGLYRGCSLKPNCDKFSEKIKLSLNPGGPFCRVGLGYIVCHQLMRTYSNVYTPVCHEIKQESPMCSFCCLSVQPDWNCRVTIGNCLPIPSPNTYYYGEWSVNKTPSLESKRLECVCHISAITQAKLTEPVLPPGAQEGRQSKNGDEGRKAREWCACMSGDRGLGWMRSHGGDSPGIAGQPAARAGALSLFPLAISACPDSSPFEGLLVLTEC